MENRDIDYIKSSMKNVSATLAIMSLIILAFGSVNAHGQTKPKRTMYVDMEALDNESIKCGIRADAISTSAKLALRRNGIDIANKKTFPYLRIDVLSLPTFINPTTNISEICVAHTLIRIIDVQEGENRNGFRVKAEHILLCNRNFIARSTRSNITKYLSDQTEEYVKSCLAEIEY